jgi:uncharacterized alpha-E superfamily protein
LRDEALHFTRIGTFIERADNTTRLLEARWRDPGGRGELHAQFHYGRFEELCAAGITPFLDRFQAKLRDVGARISNDFLASSVGPVSGGQ